MRARWIASAKARAKTVFGHLNSSPKNLNSIKVTVYLQGCLASKRCSASGLSRRYLNPYIKLKLIELAIKPYQKFWNKMFCRFFSRLLNASVTFWKLQVKANFVFRQFIFFLGFRTKSAKKACLRFAIFNCSKKLQNIFEIGFKKCEVIVQKLLSEKKYFEINNAQTWFCFLYVNLATVQIWGQSNKFPLSCNPLKCLLQAKKFIRENSAKKNLLLRKQTPPTNAFNWVLRSLSQSALGKFTTINSRWNLLVNLQKTLVFRIAPKAESLLGFSWSWSGKMGKTKKDTNARVAGRREQTKQKKARRSKCASIIFQWISMSWTIHRYRTQQRSHCKRRCYRCRVPKFLQNLSFLLTRSFCPFDPIAIASFARATFASSMCFHSFFAFWNW